MENLNHWHIEASINFKEVKWNWKSVFRLIIPNQYPLQQPQFQVYMTWYHHVVSHLGIDQATRCLSSMIVWGTEWGGLVTCWGSDLTKLFILLILFWGFDSAKSLPGRSCVLMSPYPQLLFLNDDGLSPWKWRLFSRNPYISSGNKAALLRRTDVSFSNRMFFVFILKNNFIS